MCRWNNPHGCDIPLSQKTIVLEKHSRNGLKIHMAYSIKLVPGGAEVDGGQNAAVADATATHIANLLGLAGLQINGEDHITHVHKTETNADGEANHISRCAAGGRSITDSSCEAKLYLRRAAFPSTK
jgi:hypothetical protein